MSAAEYRRWRYFFGMVQPFQKTLEDDRAAMQSAVTAKCAGNDNASLEDFKLNYSQSETEDDKQARILAKFGIVEAGFRQQGQVEDVDNI